METTLTFGLRDRNREEVTNGKMACFSAQMNQVPNSNKTKQIEVKSILNNALVACKTRKKKSFKK